MDTITKSGYTSSMNTIEADAAHIIMEKDGNSLNVYYENSEEQEIGV